MSETAIHRTAPTDASTMAMRKKLERSIAQLAAWVEVNEYKGYDPSDGLNSFLRPLTFGNQFADRVLMQVI